MTDMSVSGKKRKVAFEESERPNKKQQTAGSVKIHHHKSPVAAQPVVGKSGV